MGQGYGNETNIPKKQQFSHGKNVSKCFAKINWEPDLGEAKGGGGIRCNQETFGVCIGFESTKGGSKAEECCRSEVKLTENSLGEMGEEHKADLR